MIDTRRVRDGPSAFEIASRIGRALTALFRNTGRDPLGTVVRTAHADADRRIAAAAEPAACIAGCAYCCHQQVSATAAEVLAVAARIAALPPPERARKRVAIRRAAAATRGVDPLGRWVLRQPCPLLGPDRLCTVYEDRPFGCRGYASRDVQACREAFDSPEENGPARIPRPESTRLSAIMLSAALDRALQALSLPHHPYDLAQALDIALDTGVPAATARYLAGEDVLAAARITVPPPDRTGPPDPMAADTGRA